MNSLSHDVTTSPVVRLQARSAWLPMSSQGDPGGAFVQGSLALRYQLPNGLDAVPPPSVAASGSGSGLPPDAETWAKRFLQAVVEVVAGDRPLAQLVRWTDGEVYGEIARRQRHNAARRPDRSARVSRHQVVTVHVHQAAPHVAEVAARVHYRGRSRALAARLDLHHGRWLCTAICFG